MRVTSKGQVTIPLPVRRRQGIRTGTEVDFAERGSEIIVRKAAQKRGKTGSAIDDLAAYLARVTGIVDLGMTTDEYMELIRGE
jgi:AbrB family looped-hinge helix DNA binding protein